MGVFVWISFGILVGVIARLLMPRRIPGSWIVHIAVGVAGGVIGGWIGARIYGVTEFVNATGFASWVGSVIGAVILIGIYRMLSGRRGVKEPEHEEDRQQAA